MLKSDYSRVDPLYINGRGAVDYVILIKAWYYSLYFLQTMLIASWSFLVSPERISSTVSLPF